MLQRARGAPPRSSEEPSGAVTPKASESAASTGSPSSESDTSEATREREEQYEMWVDNMRVIETLRDYVRGRLERGEYEEEYPGLARIRRDVDAMDLGGKPKGPLGNERPKSKEGNSLYPVLPVPGT
jgi:hypothetical protein